MRKERSGLIFFFLLFLFFFFLRQDFTQQISMVQNLKFPVILLPQLFEKLDHRGDPLCPVQTFLFYSFLIFFLCLSLFLFFHSLSPSLHPFFPSFSFHPLPPDRVSGNQGWLQTHYKAHNGLEHMIVIISTSGMLRWLADVTTPVLCNAGNQPLIFVLSLYN